MCVKNFRASRTGSHTSTPGTWEVKAGIISATRYKWNSSPDRLPSQKRRGEGRVGWGKEEERKKTKQNPRCFLGS